jgi:O-methyltransferase
MGEYTGTFEEVRGNVNKYGEVSVCRFVRGWFSETLPSFREPVSVAFVDVDLVSSVRTCLRYLYPLLLPGGVIFSHDGHIPACVAAMEDEAFWKDEVGSRYPEIIRLGRKVLQIRKPLMGHPVA